MEGEYLTGSVKSHNGMERNRTEPIGMYLVENSFKRILHYSKQHTVTRTVLELVLLLI